MPRWTGGGFPPETPLVSALAPLACRGNLGVPPPSPLHNTAPLAAARSVGGTWGSPHEPPSAPAFAGPAHAARFARRREIAARREARFPPRTKSFATVFSRAQRARGGGPRG